MRHPKQETLALHAGRDLGRLASWRVARHLAQCDACAAEVAAFEDVRGMSAVLGEIPDVPWDRLAAEMKANIRLGLAAGECVREESRPSELSWFRGVRAVVACAAVAVLIAVGVALEHPRPQPLVLHAMPTVEATENGIRLSAGTSAMGLMNRGVRDVNYLPGAQGGMSATYVNASGGITVNTVYGQ